MVICKDTKAWEMVSGASNESYVINNHWIIDDDSDLALKILNLGLDWDPVLDSEGNLIDCRPHISRFVNFKIEEFRAFRSEQFKWFDIYKSNVDYGIEIETEVTRNEIISWYNTMLDFPNYITEENYETISFPITPEPIARYINTH